MDIDHRLPDVEQEIDRQDKIYWHDAFCEALRFEFLEYADSLIFDEGYRLSEEALILDAIVIKKSADVEILKNIGRIFRSHNIFEYKSESVSLSIWHYQKGVAYALLYSTLNKIPASDITISFVVTPKPVKLFAELTESRGLEIVEIHAGVYHIKGDIFPIQIIETKRLPKDENVFLKHLRSGLTVEDMEYVLGVLKRYVKLEKVNVYLDRIVDANKSVAKEVRDLSAETIDTLVDALDKNGALDKIREEGERKGRLEGRHEGRLKGRLEGERKGRLEGERKGQEKTKRDLALKLLKSGSGFEEVAAFVEMPIGWVEGLTK